MNLVIRRVELHRVDLAPGLKAAERLVELAVSLFDRRLKERLHASHIAAGILFVHVNKVELNPKADDKAKVVDLMRHARIKRVCQLLLLTRKHQTSPDFLNIALIRSA